MPGVAEATYSTFAITRTVCSLGPKSASISLCSLPAELPQSSTPRVFLSVPFHHTIYLSKQKHKMVPSCVKIKFKLQSLPFKPQRNLSPIIFPVLELQLSQNSSVTWTNVSLSTARVFTLPPFICLTVPTSLSLTTYFFPSCFSHDFFFPTLPAFMVIPSFYLDIMHSAKRL